MLFITVLFLLNLINLKYINGFVPNSLISSKIFFNNNIKDKYIRSYAWLDNTVVAKIPASLESTWELFTDLEKHPMWSPWLYEVQYHSNQKKFDGISLWTLQAFGMKFRWRAKNVEYSPPHRLAWESIDGFRNKGLVEIKPISSSSGSSGSSSCRIQQQTELKLTISYDLPEAAAAVVERISSVRAFVEETLTSDLKRFSAYMRRKDKDE